MKTLMLILLFNSLSTVSLETLELQMLRQQEEVIMTMDKDQLRSLVERTLKYLDPEIPYSEHAVELLMLTAAQESHLGTYIRQVGGGPALGIFQMEPATERDIWDNYLAYKDGLAEIADSVAGQTSEQEVDTKLPELESNLVYAITMARIHYRRVPAPLPTDLEGYASYYKKYYNTYLGKATEEEAIRNYRRLAI